MRPTCLSIAVGCCCLLSAADMAPISWAAIPAPILRGDEKTALRDPLAHYHDGVMHLYYTHVTLGDDGRPFMRLAESCSGDLIQWEGPRFLTRRDLSKNYSSPGSMVRQGKDWVMCLQTYPTVGGGKYGDKTARLFTMRSRDLITWSEPELLRVKGPDVPEEQMGRMIDPCIFPDKDKPGAWWCTFKQNGISLSSSPDLTTWTFVGSISGGENTCVVVDNGDYVLFHSPSNGIGVKRSADLRAWRDEPTLTLGQKEWTWARAGRLTAGFVLDLRREPRFGRWVMFFHASEQDEKITFNDRCHIGVAWSQDLRNWEWPR